MGLPFEPEMIESHRARLLEALLRIWDADAIATNPEDGDRPGKHRKHVFDFHSGMRLILSREIAASLGERAILHISASWQHSKPRTYQRGLKRLGAVVKALMAETEGRVTRSFHTAADVIHLIVPAEACDDLMGSLEADFEKFHKSMETR